MKKVIQSTMMACFALICMCLASCNDEAIVDMSQSNEMGQPFRLTATQETPSRLALGQDGLSVTWEPGDQLVLVKKDRSIVPIYMNAELDAPAASATFVSETGVPSGEYWVIYNYNEDLAYTHQTISSIDNINNNDKLVLWGELTVLEGESSAVIALQHLYAKVRVELQNVPSSNAWYKIGMYSSKSGFPIFKHFEPTGMIDADYVKSDYNSWEYTYKASRRKYHNIRLGGYHMETYPDELGESHSNKEEIETNAALILPADVSDGTVYFYILNGNDCYEITKSNIKFEPGKSYKVVLDMSKATKTTLNGVNISLPGDSYSTTFYQLSSPSECRHAAYRARTYDSFILMNDIDFQNDNFLPLTARNLYGNDKVLKNISLEWDNEDYVGLIKYDFADHSEGGNIDYNYSRLDPMDLGCKVTDLTLENVQIKGYSYVAALSATNIKADNCKIKGTSSVIGKGDYVGGFVGCNQFIMNVGEVGLPSSISNSTIEACSIKGDNYVGGFVGKYISSHGDYFYLDSSMRLLNSCSSAAIVEATGDYVGGIFGQIGDHTSVNFNSEDYVLSLYGCVNTGSVKGKDNVGGIGGAFSIYNTSSVKDKVIVMQSANEGNIEGANNVGGILGTNFASVNLCYSIGDFSATGNRLGGIVGSISGAASSNYITNCYSMANLSVGIGGYAGGILGSKDGGVGVAQVENCYFAGTNSTNCGIIGYSGGYVNITNCLTTLSTEGDITPKQADWDINGDGYVDANDVYPIDVINTFTSVTSIRNNKSVINNDNAYSDEIWYNYNYDCVKFAAGLTGNVTAPGFGTEIIY